MRLAILWSAAILVLAGCAETQVPAGPDLKNRVVDVVNTSAAPARFYAVNADLPAWKSTRFSEVDIPAHSYLTINFVDGSGACLYDFYATFPASPKIEQRRFDTCAEVSWVISPEGAQ